MDVAYKLSDDLFRMAMEQNLFHFSAAKTLAEIQELNRLFRESGNFGEFHRRAKETTEVFNKTWQKDGNTKRRCSQPKVCLPTGNCGPGKRYILSGST